ncbi:hypothetical protein RDWZM_008006 [Blomia tropicalis]|uniref:protein-tyrosine-phosphatase n=1 Tax=Blomia tropicalis TaxID=40697 RepID=A0A9Q0RJK5_BLOTA|nr:hypothetical protein RDWZM_008006 [Blomia tropicalis]
MAAIVPHCDDISPIIPYLYLGNYRAATNPTLLRNNGIRHVMSILSEREAISPDFKVETIQYKMVVKFDLPGEDMLLTLPECIEHLTTITKSQQGLLVHCMMGVSRSATVVLGFLMKTNGWPFEKALQVLISCRSVVNPNFGFRAQLRLFDRMGFRLDINNKELRLYMLNAIAFRNYTEQFHQNVVEYLRRLEALERTESATNQLSYTTVFRCVRCSRPVFTDLNLLEPHQHGGITTGGLMTGGSPMSALVPESNSCKYFLIEPIIWMIERDVLTSFPGNSTGKIPCPHCNALME